MMSDKSRANNGPTPQQIAAYIDGELHGAECARVAAWLATHSAAAEQADAWCRLDELCRASPPPEPKPEVWKAVFERITVGKPKRPPTPWPWRTGLITALVAMAAAVLVFVAWPKSGAPERSRLDPFPVAGPDEVVILHMYDDDRLLVAAPAPIEGPFEWAVPGDVVVVDRKPDNDGLPVHFLGQFRDFLLDPIVFFGWDR